MSLVFFPCSRVYCTALQEPIATCQPHLTFRAIGSNDGRDAWGELKKRPASRTFCNHGVQVTSVVAASGSSTGVDPKRRPDPPGPLAPRSEPRSVCSGRNPLDPYVCSWIWTSTSKNFARSGPVEDNSHTSASPAGADCAHSWVSGFGYLGHHQHRCPDSSNGFQVIVDVAQPRIQCTWHRSQPQRPGSQHPIAAAAASNSLAAVPSGTTRAQIELPRTLASLARCTAP